MLSLEPVPTVTTTLPTGDAENMISMSITDSDSKRLHGEQISFKISTNNCGDLLHCMRMIFKLMSLIHKIQSLLMPHVLLLQLFWMSFHWQLHKQWPECSLSYYQVFLLSIPTLFPLQVLHVYFLMCHLKYAEKILANRADVWHH